MKKIIAIATFLVLIVILVFCTRKSNGKVLVVGYDPFSEKFSPFFSTTAYDVDVVNMTSISLLTLDRDGGIIYNSIEGEDVSRGSEVYNYKGISNIDVNYNETSDLTTYTIEIRSDVLFSDGHALDADDIIFNYYVYLDPYYIGSNTLNSIDIVGYSAYKYNNSNYESLKGDAEELANTWINNIGKANNNNELDTYVLELMENLIADEYDWVKTNVMNSKSYLNNGYIRKSDKTPATTLEEGNLEETLAYFYALDSNYVAAGKDKATLSKEIALQYDLDYKALAESYGEASYFDSKISDKALMLAFANLESEGSPVANITGIKKLNQNKVEVKVNGYNASAIYTICGITIAPMHYYGDKGLYNYETNSFGFNNRSDNAMKIIESKTSAPMGAGPYKYIKFENNVVYFEANERYYKGSPLTKYINFQVITEEAKITLMSLGNIDISNPSGSKQTFEKIAELNKNSEITHIASVDNLGYGYVGINALKVQVGTSKNTINSHQSNSLRKAFATVLASERYIANNTYYGEAASIVNYPISNTSWAAPKAGEISYEHAYSKDVNGNDIYGGDPSTLSASDRSSKAKEAARNYLIEAGFTFSEASGEATYGGKLWTCVSPSGAKTRYEIIIPAGGKGDHPAFSLATGFKNIMKELGIQIDIIDPTNSNYLWDRLDSVSQEMWTAAWSSSIDPDLYQVYHSSSVPNDPSGTSTSNHYYIQDANLDTLILEARKSTSQAVRKEKFKEAFNIIMDWAVEVPNYQRQNVFLFSTERIKIESLTKTMTTYWSWMNEIELIEMK